MSKICATDPAISALSSKEDQTGYPASKAVLAQARLTFEVTPLEPEFLGTFKNCLTGVEALLLLATCRRNSAFFSLAKSASRWQAPSELFFFATCERRPQPEYQTLSRLATGFVKIYFETPNCSHATAHSRLSLWGRLVTCAPIGNRRNGAG